MRTYWNPDKQTFETTRPKRYSGQKQVCVRIPDNLFNALRGHHQWICESVGYKVTFNEYMTKVIEAHLRSSGIESFEAHDCSKPNDGV